jgi:hypothetical protein
MPRKILRQGDVLLVEVTEQDLQNAEKISQDTDPIILAEGETTGHAHRIARAVAALYLVGAAVRILQVQQKTQLQHEEHGAIDLDPGLYQVIQQREYSPQAIRNVAD